MFSAEEYSRIEITLHTLREMKRHRQAAYNLMEWRKLLGFNMLHRIIKKQRETASPEAWAFSGRTDDLIAACELLLDDEAAYIANCEITMARRNDDA